MYPSLPSRYCSAEEAAGAALFHLKTPVVQSCECKHSHKTFWEVKPSLFMVPNILNALFLESVTIQTQILSQCTKLVMKSNMDDTQVAFFPFLQLVPAYVFLRKQAIDCHHIQCIHTLPSCRQEAFFLKQISYKNHVHLSDFQKKKKKLSFEFTTGQNQQQIL